jgi:hypothetical protein
MKKEKKKAIKDTAESSSCCYRVVDNCGCVVGWYCCDSPEMSHCRFESSC